MSRELYPDGLGSESELAGSETGGGLPAGWEIRTKRYGPLSFEVLHLHGELHGDLGYFGPRQTDGAIHSVRRPYPELTYAGFPIRTKHDLHTAKIWDRMASPARQDFVPGSSGDAAEVWYLFRVLGLVPNTPASFGGFSAQYGEPSTQSPNFQGWRDRLRDWRRCMQGLETPVVVDRSLLYQAAADGVFDVLGCPLPGPAAESHPGDYEGPFPPPITGLPDSYLEDEVSPGREPGVIHHPDEPEETEPSTPIDDPPPPPPEDDGEPTGPDPTGGNGGNGGDGSGVLSTLPPWWPAAALGLLLLMGRRGG